MTKQSGDGGPRLCPVCQAELTLAKDGKIEIDVCEEHGVWLDQGELKAITDRVQRIEKIKAHTRTIGEVRRARHSGKVSAYLFGPLAFLFTDR